MELLRGIKVTIEVDTSKRTREIILLTSEGESVTEFAFRVAEEIAEAGKVD